VDLVEAGSYPGELLQDEPVGAREPPDVLEEALYVLLDLLDVFFDLLYVLL
jgi:hypothetical protein